MQIAVLIGTKRTASVRAKTYCNLFTLKKDDLNLMIMHYPTLGKMMQDSIMSKLESMVQGEVAMVSQEEALRMAKSMRREVHRLGAMVQQVSKMNMWVPALESGLRCAHVCLTSCRPLAQTAKVQHPRHSPRRWSHCHARQASVANWVAAFQARRLACRCRCRRVWARHPGQRGRRAASKLRF